MTILLYRTSAGTQTGVNYLAPGGGRDGNSIELLEMDKTSTTYLTAAGASKLTGGADPSSVHFHIDLTASGIGFGEFIRRQLSATLVEIVGDAHRPDRMRDGWAGPTL